jgi:hypothetical protein
MCPSLFLLLIKSPWAMLGPRHASACLLHVMHSTKSTQVIFKSVGCVLQVNKIRELPQHPAIIVTHTDAPELYVWNTVTQPNMTRDQVRHSPGC